MRVSYFRSILIALAVVSFTCVSCEPEKTELVFALFRNGARTPEKSEIFPHQLFSTEKDWPLGFGQLTNNGKNEMYNLGKLIRDTYKSYLGDNPIGLSAKSLDIDRCMESAELVAIGAYPPVGEFVWNKECNWQPFAVHLFDRIPEAHLNCGNEYKEMKKILDANSSRVADKMCEDLVSYLHERSSNQLNLTCDTLAKLSNFYKILKENKLATPFYVNDVYDRLTQFRKIYNELKAKTKCEQISSARVLFDVKDKIETRNQSLQTRIQLYGVSSEKLETILRILEDESDEQESTVTALFIDLFLSESDNNLLRFNVLHEGGKSLIPLRVQGCHNTTICTLDEFYGIFNALAIEKVSVMSGKVKAIIVLASLLAFLTTLMSGFMFFIWRKKSQAKKKQYQEIHGN